jgi:hypothetical protein
MPVQIPLNKSFITLANCGLNRQLSCIPSLDANNAYENHIFRIVIQPFDKYTRLDFFCAFDSVPDWKWKVWFVFCVYGEQPLI